MSARCGLARRLAAAALIGCVAACAAQPAGSPDPAAAPDAGPLAPQAFFWKVEAPGGAPLFLLGSVHIGDERTLQLDPGIEEEFGRAEELVVELDTSSMSPVDAVEATNHFGMLPSGWTLRNVVRASTYGQVAQYMKQRGYDMERVDRMRPWLVAQVVTQLEYEAAGLDADNGVDAVLMRRAEGRKPIAPLESLEEQVAIFATMPQQLQERMLVEMLREATDFVALTRSILAAWERGDEATLGRLLFAHADEDPELAQFYERVFFARNRSMTDRLLALAADGRSRFVVVGTGHLIGERGIPALLADRGLAVTRVGGRVLATPPAPEPGAIPPPAPVPAPVVTAPVEPAPAAPGPARAAPPPAPAQSRPTPTTAGSAPSTPAQQAGRDVQSGWLVQDAQPAEAPPPAPVAAEPAPPAAPPADSSPPEPRRVRSLRMPPSKLR